MRARRLSWLLAGLLATCAPAQEETSMPMPGRLVQALDALRDLEATAYLVAREGAPGEGTPLARGDDGVTFSGFIAAPPGDYTLEVVFRGVPADAASSERVFLGRWTSNAFTISAGTAASPAFTRPLDTIGRPEDGGDADGDGLGMLDEILWSANPGDADTDDDGAVDGDDCTPGAPSDTYAVLEGGSQEDCDGDGVVRADLPYGRPGQDCDDHDPLVRPGAMDDCADAVDQDCNPATCPIDDSDGPTISNVTPAAGGTLGCHRTVSADVADASGVAAARVVIEGAMPSGDATLFMTSAGGDRWTSTALNAASGVEGLTPGTYPARIVASDGELNESVVTTTYELALAVPSVERLTPDAVDTSGPFDVTIEASSSEPLASITLYAAPVNAQGLYSTSSATELGGATESPATIRVDVSSLPAGSYMLYPVVQDQAGNRLQPGIVASAIGGPGGTRTTADYSCLRSPSGFWLPVRLFTVGPQNLFRPTMMLEHLDEATALIGAMNPNAVLVSMIGFGADADGTIRLDRGGSYGVWIQYSFYDPGAVVWLSVMYRTQARVGANPVIDPDAGNVSATDPILDPSTLVDSDAAVMAATQSGCAPPGSSDSDYVHYANVGGQDVVDVSKDGGGLWRGTAHAPITEIFGCN